MTTSETRPYRHRKVQPKGEGHRVRYAQSNLATATEEWVMSAGSWGHSGTRCKIKDGWEGAGREGDAISFFEHERLGQYWIVVIWDDEDDPDCFKAAGLLIKRLGDSMWSDAP